MKFTFIKTFKKPVLALSALSFLLCAPALAQETKYPLTIKNCGRVLTFDKKPEKVVSVGQNSTEILYALGLGDKVKGTALWYSDVMPQFSEVNKTVPVLSPNVPSFESILEKQPDLVASHQEWVIGPNGSSATYQQFDDFKIPVYTAPADCTGKDNMADGDGLRTQPFTMDMIYQEIAELAEIFDVQDRGAALIADLKAREKAAIDKVADFPKDKLSAFFWYSSADLDLDPYVAGRLGAAAYIMNTLGIKNVIESDNEWPTISWEYIVNADPSLIVLAKMERRRFPADDVEEKRKYLNSDALTKMMSAVKNDALVEMDVQSMNPTMRTIDGIEALANAIAQSGIIKN